MMNALSFPPPDAAVSLYPGQVMHARLKPFGHRFSYTVLTLLIDIDRLDEADRAARLFSVGRFNLYGFDIRDHGAGDGSPLRPHIDGAFAKAGLAEPPARVLLLCYPRILGKVFDPLSVYFAYDRQERLVGVIYEVRNTFGERHSYVAPVKPGELDEAGLRQERDKLFYVSPFLDMALRYHFRLKPPGDGIAVRILETDADGPIFAATFIGQRRPMTTRGLLRAFAAIPFLTAKVVGGIHWEALKLWFKGARLVSRPAAPAPLSVEGKGGYSEAVRRREAAENAPAVETRRAA